MKTKSIKVTLTLDHIVEVTDPGLTNSELFKDLCQLGQAALIKDLQDNPELYKTSVMNHEQVADEQSMLADVCKWIVDQAINCSDMAATAEEMLLGKTDSPIDWDEFTLDRYVKDHNIPQGYAEMDYDERQNF